MGKDYQPKARQANKLARRRAQRATYDRILIVSEGSKTEPNYFLEIRNQYRLHTANVQVQPSVLGTQPLQVVEYAQSIFVRGEPSNGIQPRAFEQVYAVFDRDDHSSYHAALAKAASLDGKLRNDLGATAAFRAIASIPCFEVWLLMHFEDVLAPLHRNEVYERLRHHLPNYAKGSPGQFAATRINLAVAVLRAEQAGARANAYDGIQPYTDVAGLVSLLTALKPE